MKIEMTAVQSWLDDLVDDAGNGRRHFETRWTSKDTTWGITGSTFRAFTGRAIPPSISYRKWAESVAETITQDKIANLAKCRQILRASLVNAWKESGGELSTTYRDKLLDLFLMHMARSPAMREDNRAILIENGNVPLDRHSLRGLGLILPAMAIGVPSMGAIESEVTYNAIQEIIRRITSELGLPNLHFDIWTWPSDRRHQAMLPSSTLPA